MSNFKDLTGQRFGRLTALERVGTTKSGKAIWRCLCDCSNYKNITSGNLLNGNASSCGCLRSEMVTKWNKERCGEKNPMYGRKGDDHPASKNIGMKNPAFGKVYHAHGAYVNLPNGETIYVRSSYEKRVANCLIERGIDFKFESKTFNLGNSTYTPDFYIPSDDIYIEVKGYLRDDSRRKMEKFAKTIDAEKLRVIIEKDIIEIEKTDLNTPLDFKNIGSQLSTYLRDEGAHKMKMQITLSEEFDDLYERMEKSGTGKKLLEIDGIYRNQLNVGRLSHLYFTDNLSNVTIDNNANADEGISPNNYGSEITKGVLKIEGYYLIHRYAVKRFGLERANELIKAIVYGDVYFHDASGVGVQQPYCYATSTTMIMLEGRPYGHLHSLPPKRADSFMAQCVEYTMDLSQAFCGAVSLSDVVINYAWYAKRENLSKENILNDFQKYTHVVNNSFRVGGQSPFTNISIFDRPNLEKIFEHHRYPDGSSVDYDYVMDIQKMFVSWFSKGDPQSGLPYRFPVVTLNLSTGPNKDIIDKDFLEFVSKENIEKGCFNIYVNSGNKIASCCRLINDSERMMFKADTFSNGGTNIGSHRVVTINLPRIALKSKGNVKKFNIELTRCLEITRDLLLIHREEILRRRVDRGFLRFFKPLGWFSLKHLFSTIGLIGVHEMNELMGYNISDQDGTDFTLNVLNSIEDFAKKTSIETKNSFNVEEVPGEQVSSKLCQKDKVVFGTKRVPFEMYSNQYIPLIEDVSIPDRIKTTGKFMEILSGGGILHLNIKEKITDPEIMKNLIEYAVKNGVAHMAINYGFGTCKNGHTSVCGNATVCPKCGDEITNHITRIIGYFAPIKNWSKTRREYEFPRRVFS